MSQWDSATMVEPWVEHCSRTGGGFAKVGFPHSAPPLAHSGIRRVCSDSIDRSTRGGCDGPRNHHPAR